jgi:membrane-associated phospholipid phosphatase
MKLQTSSRDSTDLFAGLVAALTHPVIIGTLGLLTVVSTVIPTFREQIFYLALLILITFMPAAFYLLVHFKGNVNEMFELIDREARLIPYILMILGAVGAVFVLSQIDAPKPIFIMTLVLLANEIVLGTINFWTKVSIHTATASFTALTLGYLIGFEWYAIIFLVPLIGWARVYRRRHTVKQVVGGAIFSAVITIIVLFLGALL